MVLISTLGAAIYQCLTYGVLFWMFREGNVSLKKLKTTFALTKSTGAPEDFIKKHCNKTLIQCTLRSTGNTLICIFQRSNNPNAAGQRVALCSIRRALYGPGRLFCCPGLTLCSPNPNYWRAKPVTRHLGSISHRIKANLVISNWIIIYFSDLSKRFRYYFWLGCVRWQTYIYTEDYTVQELIFSYRSAISKFTSTNSSNIRADF